MSKRPVLLSGRIIGMVVISLFVGIPIAAIVRKSGRECPINFSLSRRHDKLKLIGHQTPITHREVKSI